jgi:hypothetical protein
LADSSEWQRPATIRCHRALIGCPPSLADLTTFWRSGARSLNGPGTLDETRNGPYIMAGCLTGNSVMPSQRPKMFWRPLRHRLSAAFALIAYFAATSGLPLPGAVVHGQPTLYQNRPCGYRPADDPSEHCCCCGIKGEPASNDAPPPADKACPSCTGSSKSCCAGHSDTAPRPSAPGRRLPGLTTAKCHCITTAWLTTGEVCPPPPPLTWLPYLPPAGDVSLAGAGVFAIKVTPPDPPPRPLEV